MSCDVCCGPRGIVIVGPTDRFSLEVEVDVHVFAESGGIVVAIRFRVSESLQDAIGLD